MTVSSPIPASREHAACDAALARLDGVGHCLEAAGPTAILQAMLIAVLCVRTTGTDDAAAALADRAADLEAAEFGGCDGALVLMAAGAFRRLRGGLPAELASWVGTAAAVLGETEDPGPDLHFSRWALHRLGLIPAPPPPPLAVPAGKALLFADAATLRVCAGAIAAASGYGTRPVVLPSGVQAVLRVCASHCIAAYEFQVGGALLRALAVAGGRGDRAVEWGRSFLLDHQTPQGGFGHLEREVQWLRRGEPRFEPLRIELPFTLSALWTLAETGPAPFSFCDHLFSAAPPPP